MLLLRTAARSNNAASRTPSIISSIHATSKAQDLQGILLLKRSPKVPSSNPSSSSVFHHNVWNQSLSYPLTHTPSIGSIALLPRKLEKAHKRFVNPPSGQGMSARIKEYPNSSSSTNTLSCLESARSFNHKGRSDQTSREAGYSGGTADEGSILESTIHRTEARWIIAAGNKSKTLEPPYPQTMIQDGRDLNSKEHAQTGRLDGLYQSQGCVPLRVYGRSTSKILTLPMARPAIRIPVPSLRIVQRSKNLHKVVQACDGSSKTAWSAFGRLPGRYTAVSTVERGSINSSNSDVKVAQVTGVCDQPRKVAPETNSEDTISRFHNIFPVDDNQFAM